MNFPKYFHYSCNIYFPLVGLHRWVNVIDVPSCPCSQLGRSDVYHTGPGPTGRGRGHAAMPQGTLKPSSPHLSACDSRTPPTYIMCYLGRRQSTSSGTLRTDDVEISWFRFVIVHKNCTLSLPHVCAVYCLMSSAGGLWAPIACRILLDNI